jgi:hypothetical protein
MNIAFILFSDSAEYRRTVRIDDSSVVPSEIRKKYGVNYKFYTCPPHLTDVNFAMKVLSENDGYSVVALSTYDNKPIRDLGFPSSILDVSSRTTNTELSRVTTFWTKRLTAINRILEPLVNRKALLLPFRNFRDDEVDNRLHEIFNNFGERTFSLAEEIEKLLAHLKSREFPKKRGTFRDKYFVDDRGFHFQYGHEVHSRPETVGGEHNLGCLAKSKLRLGIPYTNVRHFNVSVDGNVSLRGSKLVTCHGSEFLAGNTEHLNIFPNDFIVSQK